MKMFKSIVLLLISATPQLYAQALNNNYFEVTGEVKRSFFKTSTGIRQTTFYFELQANNKDWMIKVHEKGLKDYYVITSKENRCFYYRNLENSIMEAKKNGEKVGINTGTGIIIGENIPRFPMIAEGAFIWLTFLGQHAYKDEGQQLRISCISDQQLGFGMATTSKLYKQASYLEFTGNKNFIRNIEFFYEGIDTRSNQKLPLFEIDSNLTNSKYSLLEEKTVNKTEFPSKSNLIVYTYNTKEKKIEKWSEYGLKIEDIKPLSINSVISPPQTVGVTSFDDFRFDNSESDGIYFSYITNKWLPDNEVKQLDTYKSTVSMMKNKHDDWSKNIRYISITLVFLAILFAFNIVNKKRTNI